MDYAYSTCAARSDAFVVALKSPSACLCELCNWRGSQIDEWMYVLWNLSNTCGHSLCPPDSINTLLCNAATQSRRFGKVAAIDRWLLWVGGCCGQVAAVDRWLLWTGGCCGQVAAVDRWLLWASGCFRQVAALDRWLLWVGGCFWLVAALGG